MVTDRIFAEGEDNSWVAVWVRIGFSSFFFLTVVYSKEHVSHHDTEFSLSHTHTYIP